MLKKVKQLFEIIFVLSLYLTIIYLSEFVDFQNIHYKEIIINSISFIIFFLFYKTIKEFIIKKELNKYVVNEQKILINNKTQKIGLSSSFYGPNTKLKFKNKIIKSPMIYVTDSLDVAYGESINFLIFKEMNFKIKKNQKNKIEVRNIENFVKLHQNEKEEFLKWIMNKNYQIQNPNLLVIYIDGLIYRFLHDEKNKMIIYKEIIQIYDNYKDTQAVKEKIEFFLEIIYKDLDIINKISKDKFYSDFNILNLNYKSPIRYQILFNFLAPKKDEYQNAELYLSYYLASKTKLNNLNQDLFNFLKIVLKNYLSQNKDLPTPKIEQYQTVFNNFTYNNNKIILNNFDDIKSFLDKVMKECSNFITSLNQHSLSLSYSLLPIKYKKIYKHPSKDKLLNNINRKSYLPISEIVDDIFSFDEKITLKDSKKIVQLLNDNLYAIEPDSKFTQKAYKIDEIVAIYKKGNKVHCKNKEVEKYQHLVDLVFSYINSDTKENQKIIINFFENKFIKNFDENERIIRRIKSYFKGRNVDLRSVVNYNFLKKDIKEIVVFLEQNKDSFKIKDHRIVKLKKKYNIQ